MSRKLDNSHFSFKCPMDFDAMEHTAGGRFCNRCRKEVFDLTNCSLDEVAALQKKHGSLCGFIQVAAVAASLSAAACADKSSSPSPPYCNSDKSGGTIHPLPDNSPESKKHVP